MRNGNRKPIDRRTFLWRSAGAFGAAAERQADAFDQVMAYVKEGFERGESLEDIMHRSRWRVIEEKSGPPELDADAETVEEER